MKKSIIIVILLLSIQLHSQEFHGGILSGFTASQVDGDGYGGYDKTGVMLGAFVNRAVNEKYKWQMEIFYSHRGSKKNMHPNKNDYTFYKMHLEYLEVPLLVIYKYSDILSFTAGLGAGTLVRFYEENEYQRFYSDRFKKFTINSIIGVQYKLSEKISLDLRETYSVRPIRGYADQGRWWYKTGSFNNSLSFTVNYHF